MLTNGISLTICPKSILNPSEMVRKTDRFGVQNQKESKALSF